MSAKRIFIVEDEGIVAADLEERLKRMGYTVVGRAAAGEKAIEQIPKIRPDLVLMDIILQGKMDGVEAAEQILKQQNIPVVFLTAHADDPTMKRARLTGPFGYVLKPFDERELHVAVEIALYRAQMETALRQANRDLANALAEIKTLSGLLPICAWCRKIRDDGGYWQQLEAYVEQHTDAQFSHSICPDCMTKVKDDEMPEAQTGARSNHGRQRPQIKPEV